MLIYNIQHVILAGLTHTHTHTHIHTHTHAHKLLTSVGLIGDTPTDWLTGAAGKVPKPENE